MLKQKNKDYGTSDGDKKKDPVSYKNKKENVADEIVMLALGVGGNSSKWLWMP